MNDFIFKTKLWMICVIACLACPAQAKSMTDCRHVVDKLNSEDYEWKNQANVPDEYTSGFDAFILGNMPGCRVFLVERNDENTSMKIRLALFEKKNNKLKLVAKGAFPLDESVGSPAVSTFISATRFPFPNQEWIIRLKARWTGGGGGFGTGSEDSYYIFVKDGLLRPIFSMSDAYDSHHATGERDCLDITESKSKFSFASNTKNSSWPDLSIEKIETVFLECGTSIKNKKVNKSHRQLRWTGKRYEEIAATAAAAGLPKPRNPPLPLTRRLLPNPPN